MTTNTGKCLFAEKDETAIFKIVGSLRFNTRSGLSAKVERVSSMPQIKDIVVDMTETPSRLDYVNAKETRHTGKEYLGVMQCVLILSPSLFPRR